MKKKTAVLAGGVIADWCLFMIVAGVAFLSTAISNDSDMVLHIRA